MHPVAHLVAAVVAIVGIGATLLVVQDLIFRFRLVYCRNSETSGLDRGRNFRIKFASILWMGIKPVAVVLCLILFSLPVGVVAIGAIILLSMFSGWISTPASVVLVIFKRD